MAKRVELPPVQVPEGSEVTAERIRQIEEKALRRLHESKEEREARKTLAQAHLDELTSAAKKDEDALRARDPKRRLWLALDARRHGAHIGDEKHDESADDSPSVEHLTREPAGPGAVLSWPEIKLLQLRGVGAGLEGDPTIQFRDGKTKALPVDAAVRALMRHPDVPENEAHGASVLVDIPSVAAIAASNADEDQKQAIVLRALDLLERATPLHGLPHAYSFLQFVLGRRIQAIGMIAESIAPLSSGKAYAELSDESALFETAGAVADTLERIAKHEAIEALVQSASVATDIANVRISDHMRKGIFSWDAVLADELEQTGTQGKKLANIVRDAARQRAEAMTFGRGGAEFLREWIWPVTSKGVAIPFGLPMLRPIARAVWLDVVQPKRKRDAERNPAGLVRTVVHDRLLPAMTRQLQIPTLDDGAVRDASGKVIGRITMTTDATLEAARNGLAQLGSVAGHRLVRSLVHRAHDQYEAGTGDFRHVRYEGGFAALLETVGLAPNYGETIRQIAEAGQAIRWHASHAEGGGFWTWTHQRGARGRQGHVSFVLGEVLLPGNATAMRVRGNQSPSARIARRIIPELRGEVPIPAGLSPDKHGAAWTLHRMMLVELVDNARALATAGFASIPSNRVAELARSAGLTKPDDLARVLDAFTNGAGDVAPIFKRDGDGWTLADYHARERDYIADLGKRQATGQAGGKRAARKRLEGAPRKRRSRET